jgi:hypothetical protein
MPILIGVAGALAPYAMPQAVTPSAAQASLRRDVNIAGFTIISLQKVAYFTRIAYTTLAN